MNKDEKIEELEKAREDVINFWIEQISELKEDLKRAKSKIKKLENSVTNFYKLYDKSI